MYARIPHRRERVSQLVRQRGKELVLASVGLTKSIFRISHLADVEIDTGPAQRFAFGVSHENASREYRMVPTIDTAHPMLDVPVTTLFHAGSPRFERLRTIVWMQSLGPPESRALFLCHANESQEGIARIHVASVGVAHPHAIVDRLADGAIQPFGPFQGLVNARGIEGLVVHVIWRTVRQRGEPDGIPDSPHNTISTVLLAVRKAKIMR